MSFIIQMKKATCGNCGRVVCEMDGKIYEESSGHLHVCEVTERDREVRSLIMKHLLALDKDLEKYEQTTHGSMFTHSLSIDDVCQQLALTFKKSGSFSISELSQRINALVRLSV